MDYVNMIVSLAGLVLIISLAILLLVTRTIEDTMEDKRGEVKKRVYGREELGDKCSEEELD